MTDVAAGVVAGSFGELGMEGELEVICNRGGAWIFANGKIEGTRFKVQELPTLVSRLPGGFENVTQVGVRASRRFFTRNLVGVGEYWRSMRPCFFASLGVKFFCEGATLSCDISMHPVKSRRRGKHGRNRPEFVAFVGIWSTRYLKNGGTPSPTVRAPRSAPSNSVTARLRENF